MQEILIIKPSSLGDIVHGLQIAQSIKAQMRGVRITWVVRDVFKSIVQAADAIDEILIFEREGGLIRFLRLIEQIRKRRYDYVLDMQGLARSALMTFFARSNQKLGRIDARECAGFFYHQKVGLRSHQKAHAIEILQEFLTMLNLRKDLLPPLKFSPKIFDKPSYQNYFRENPPILIFPNSRRKEKEWWGFADLSEALLKSNLNYPIIWLGQDKLQEKDWQNQNFHNFIGKTSLLDILGFIQNARLVISNDSGPMHLAAALHKPLVALFGPTDQERFGPYPLKNPLNQVIAAPNQNLRELCVETVMEKVLSFLSPNNSKSIFKN